MTVWFRPTRLKSNVLTNYAAQIWNGVIGLAFVPLYVRVLGVEAYGLVGFYAVLQVWLSVLDGGLTPMLQREMALYTAGGQPPQRIRNLLQTAEVLCLGMALVIGLIVWTASGPLARHWLDASTLAPSTVANAVTLMGVVVGLRFLEGVYRSAFLGLQHQVAFNGISALANTLRYGGGAAVVVWLSPTITAFFAWQAVISLGTVVALGLCLRRLLPRAPERPRFALTALAGTWRFSASMLGMAALGLGLTQFDKIILSGTADLSTFGYYTLASLLAGSLSLLVAPLMQGIYPRFVQLTLRGRENSESRFYHQCSQLVTSLAASAAVVLWLYAQGVVYTWTGDRALADSVGPLLSVLVLSVFFNQVITPAHNLQVAHGTTRLILIFQFSSLCLLAPAAPFVIHRFGAMGAAWMQFSLFAAYILCVIPLMHRSLLKGEGWRWAIQDFVLPTAGAVAGAAALGGLAPSFEDSRWAWLAFFCAVGTAAGLGAAVMSGEAWPVGQSLLNRFRRRDIP